MSNSLEFNHEKIIHSLKSHKENVESVENYGKKLAKLIENSELMRKRENHLNYLFNLCAHVQKNFTIFVCGEVNSGKSLFISEFLKGRVQLPSNDEPCTCRMTRIKYHSSDIIRKVKFRGSPELATIIDEQELNDDLDLESWISLETHDRYKHDEVNTIIEIGLNSDILRNGLEIVDCPGMGENKTISDAELSLLSIMKPNLIIYIYDGRRVFCLNDVETLQRIERVLKDFDVKSPEHTQYIILANKIDIDRLALQRDRSCDIDNLHASNYKLITEATRTIKRYFPDDYQEKLPIFPISTRKLCEYRIYNKEEYLSTTSDMENKYFIDRLNDLMDKLCHKIEDMACKIACCFSYWIHVDLNEFKSKSWSHEAKHEFMDIWFKIKSLEVNHSLKKLLNNQSKFKMLVEFSDGYTVQGSKFETNYIHRTTLSRINTSNEAFIRDKEHIYNTDFRPYTIVYTSDASKSIQIIKYDCTERRLMDELSNLSFDQVMKYIKHFVQYNGMLIRFKHKIIRDIRPDNLYLTEDKIRNNRDVPVRPDSLLILKHQRRVKPFYLWSYWMAKLQGDKSKLSDSGKDKIFYRFGWIIWIMLEGSGDAEPRGKNSDEWIDQLKQSRFSQEDGTMLCQLENVMKICWNVTLHNISESWAKVQAIVESKPVDEWLSHESDKVKCELKQVVECGDTKFASVDFEEGYEVFFCKYKGDTIQIVLLNRSKCTSVDFNVEKLRMYEMFQREPGMIFESVDKSRVYIIHNEIPTKRLIDLLPTLDLSDVVIYIQQIVNDLSEKFTLFNPLWPFFKKKNFRPDNIYVNEVSKRLILNYDVPAHPKIPLILCQGQKLDPYYLKMNEKSLSTETTYPEITGNQFVHRFGWVVWTLLKGSDITNPQGAGIEDWLNDLETGLFRDYPNYLKEVMRICWSVCENRCWEDSWLNVKDLVEKNSERPFPINRLAC